MNLPVFLRRFFIVFFSLCLILNVGYNFVNWIKTANFSKNKNELGTIKIYSSDKKQLTKLPTMYFEGNKETKVTLDDIYGKPIYYLKANIGKKHFKYAKKYFTDNNYNISMISSSENSNEIKIEREFIKNKKRRIRNLTIATIVILSISVLLLILKADATSLIVLLFAVKYLPSFKTLAFRLLST